MIKNHENQANQVKAAPAGWLLNQGSDNEKS